MPVKIRLQRHGKKGKPFYWVVAADARAKRDGKFLEKLGQYDPNAETVLKDVNVDGIKAWVAKGAQLSDTVSSLLKKQGVKL